MNISLLNESSQGKGGGWSFMSNLAAGLTRRGIPVVTDWHDADVCIISGATMVTRTFIEQVKSAGKKIVLRVDNMPRNSRNRNTGTSRLFDFAQMADSVVYQSDWAKDYIGPFLKRSGPVIINSVDEHVFSSSGPAYSFGQQDQVYLYSRFNRDETKCWEVAWYEYQMIQRENPQAMLAVVGNFSDEIRAYNFDFFMSETYTYLGVIDDPFLMAAIYRGANTFLMSYFNDACSNTLIEALCCGMDVRVVGLGDTGGSRQIMDEFKQHGAEYFGLDRMTDEYITLLAAL